jgi:hypothetical protein
LNSPRDELTATDSWCPASERPFDLPKPHPVLGATTSAHLHAFVLADEGTFLAPPNPTQPMTARGGGLEEGRFATALPAATDADRGVSAEQMTRLAVIGAALFLLVPAMLMPPRAFGDSGEYMLTAESLLNHATPDLRPGDLALLASRAARQPIEGGIRTLSAYRRSRTGSLYALHFWAYAAATLPVRLALHRLGAHEYKAFAITNALLLLAAFWAIITLAPYPPPWRLLAGALLVVSPIGWFVTMPHPEVFTASLVTIALCFWCAGARAKATAAAAIASLQNPPLVLLVALMWAGTVRAPALAPAPARGRRVALATAAALPAAAPFLFNLWAFGTLSEIAEESTHLSLVGLGRALELIFDLNIGLLPYAPLTVILALAATVQGLRLAAARGSILAAWVLLVAMALVCSSVSNWNHGTSGPSRYAVWLYPIVLFVILEALGRGRSSLALAGTGLALGSQLLVFASRGVFLAPQDYLEHSWLARLVLRHAPSCYAPTAEIFAERTAHEDSPARGPFVFVADGRCRKALAQKRHADALRELCGSEPATFTRFRSPAQRDGGRGDWTYVDYD